MKIGIVGLGLIGGSLAKAITKHTKHQVFGTDKDDAVLNSAKHDGTVLETECDLSQMDLIFICLYPDEAIRFIEQNAGQISKNAVVADTCGIKQKVCASLSKIAARHGFSFVGTHPMAGKEQGGYVNSSADLFDNASFIIAPCGADPAAVEMVENLALSIGFGQITKTTPEEHDRIIAFTSQLPHALAVAYISDPDAKKHVGFSAGSYKDVSRVARINAALWTELFLENGPALCDHIEVLIENLSAIRGAIETENKDLLFTLLETGDTIKREIG